MSVIYILQEGAYVRKEGERVKVTRDKEVILDVPMIKVDQIVLFGPTQVSSQALAEFLKRDIEVCFLTKNGRYRGRIQPQFSKNSILRKAQFQASIEDKKSLELSRAFVYGKLSNMRTLLRRACRQKFLGETAFACKRITNIISKLKQSTTIEEVRGCEGEGTSAYFYAFKKLVKVRDFRFSSRVKRPPGDPINALLSFGYTLLFNEVLSACNIVGFDPYIGYLHSDKYGKPSLALDLMEEWRPVLTDSLVLSLVNKKVVKISDFVEELGSVYKLKDAARKRFIESYERRKRSQIKHPLFNYRVTYWRSIELQARILGKVLMGEAKTYIPFLIK
jgi:CRISPR-associated protein Cas1